MRPGSHRTRRSPATAGFTLAETMIVSAILAIVATVGLTKYGRAIRVARTEKAKQELKVLSHEIDLYQVQNGFYPETLADVGRGGKLDPWGLPYMYLNFTAGTGSAVEFVMSNGLIDPQAVKGWNAANKGKKSKKSKKSNKGKAKGHSKQDDPEPETYPADAAKVVDLKRKDAFLFPLNTDYDLFSLGPNGKGWASITENFSLDDVIRANDGAFFGVAKDY